MLNYNVMNRNSCRNILTVLLAGGLVLTPAMAQDQPAAGQMEHRMSLKDCMEYAISNSTKMRISEADRGDEQATEFTLTFR